MTPSEARFLRTFQSWLDAMGGEVAALGKLLESDEAPPALRGASAASVAYLLRSFDIIPEGLEGLGYLDDVFVFRALAQRAVLEDPDAASFDASGTIARLAAEAELVAEFLGEDYPRLQAAAFSSGPAHAEGRHAEDLLKDPELCAAALGEARAWAESYRAPELANGAEELVKLRSFFRTKLERMV
jgi:uncharacterized membrane protein YkvA (DUF1232 family)